MSESRGERWFWRLVGLTAVVGSIWYYTWLLPGPARLYGLTVVLVASIGVIVWYVRARDIRQGLVARAAQLERQQWGTTLPDSANSRPRFETGSGDDVR
jgi:hypothetical protein